MNATKADDKLPLNQLIQQVRSELIEAMNQRDESGKMPALVVENVTLEINFVVEKSEKVQAGAKSNWIPVVFDVGGEKTHSNQQVHKVTIQLKALEKRTGNGSGSKTRKNSDEIQTMELYEPLRVEPPSASISP